MSVLHVGDVEGSTLSVAACIAGHVGVLCVCVWDTRLASLLVELANEKAAAVSIDLGWKSLDLWAGLQGPAGGVTGPQSCWRQWPLLKSLNKM